jgi:glycosyltransferase involved in cell wall biosynthesis
MISLAIIAKDEKEKLENIVKNYGKYFDEIVIGADDDMEIEGARVIKYELSDEEKEFGGIFFDWKRNWLASHVKGDYYFRMDTDDTLIGLENLQEVYEKAVKFDVDIISCYYDYGRDQWGNTHAAHYRESLIKNTDKVYWNKHIHENLIPVEGYNFKIVEDDHIKVIHDIASSSDEDRNARNLKYLVAEYRKDGDKTDPRTLAYLGRMLSVLEPEKGKFFLQKHIEKSGWDEDKVLSYVYLAEIFINEKDFDNAIACCTEAMLLKPDLPDAYLKLHDVYFYMSEWKKAIVWGEKGLRLKSDVGLMIQDPAGKTWRPCLTMSISLFNENRLTEAMAFLQKAKEFVPDHEVVLENEKLYAQVIRDNNFVKGFRSVYEYLDDSAKKTLSGLIPKSLIRHPYLSDVIVSHLPTKTWEEGSVAIFCGRSPMEWSPLSLLTGIGGSEEAVIQMSKELQAQGKKVTVFCECGDNDGVFSGVEYKDTIMFNPSDTFDTVIAWRGNFFDVCTIKARNKILWLHDFPQQDQFTKCDFDKVVVLSEYHKSLLPANVPEEKIFVSTNGLVPKDFNNLIIDRKRGRIIYASSYDRGLELLLKNWKKVKEEVPYAELHIFYGWNTYDKFVECYGRSIDYKNYLVDLMNQEGVFEHGRVGHKKLLKEYCKSEVFAYPTDFAGEINCIALSKAIACGCRCVTNDLSVLKERNPDVVCSNEEFTDKLIETLKQENKNELNKGYINDLSWENVARSWIKNIL